MCEISMIIIVKQNRADLSELIVNHSLFALFPIRAIHCLLHVERETEREREREREHICRLTFNF